MIRKIKLLYFASLGEGLQCDEEVLSVEASVATVADLKAHLSQRGESWASLLNAANVRCAVNQSIGDDHTRLDDAHEVAFFPPVTGG